MHLLFKQRKRVEDPFLGYFKILRVFLNADEFTIEILASNAGRTAAHRWIKHSIAFVGVGLHEVFEKGDGFLGGVLRFTSICDRLKILYSGWVS